MADQQARGSWLARWRGISIRDTGRAASPRAFALRANSFPLERNTAKARGIPGLLAEICSAY